MYRAYQDVLGGGEDPLGGPHRPCLTRFSVDLGAHSWALHRCARPRNWVTGPFTLKYIWMQSSLTSGCPICKRTPSQERSPQMAVEGAAPLPVHVGWRSPEDA